MKTLEMLSAVLFSAFIISFMAFLIVLVWKGVAFICGF